MCAAQGAMEAALAEEVHESQQVPGAERNHSVRRQPRNGHLSRKRSADEPASCKAYTTPPKNPYTNTGFVPWSRDDWAHWIIMSMMVTLYAAYKTAASQRA